MSTRVVRDAVAQYRFAHRAVVRLRSRYRMAPGRLLPAGAGVTLGGRYWGGFCGGFADCCDLYVGSSGETHSYVVALAVWVATATLPDWPHFSCA